MGDYEIQPLTKGTRRDPAPLKYNKAAGKSPFGKFPPGYGVSKKQPASSQQADQGVPLPLQIPPQNRSPRRTRFAPRGLRTKAPSAALVGLPARFAKVYPTPMRKVPFHFMARATPSRLAQAPMRVARFRPRSFAVSTTAAICPSPLLTVVIRR